MPIVLIEDDRRVILVGVVIGRRPAAAAELSWPWLTEPDLIHSGPR